VKNYTYDTEGQLVAVAAQEPWGFHYDSNGNMLSLIYRYLQLTVMMMSHRLAEIV
jgi:RHS Repeat.